MTTADLYMQAVRRGDEQGAAMFARELEAQGYGAPHTREAIRDLTEVFALSADEHNRRLREGLERQRLGELVGSWGPPPETETSRWEQARLRADLKSFKERDAA